MVGATLDPEDAYRFSRGEEVVSHLDPPVKPRRSLDFIVLADHAENVGLAKFIRQDKAHIVEPSEHRFEDVLIEAQSDPSLNVMATDLSAAGLAAVWATENTREALFDALQCKEVFATTGLRLRVRVFARWDFTKEEELRPDFASEDYARGVPVGADLRPAPEGAEAPSFMVQALRDPDGVNLDRIQIIKGSVQNGEAREKSGTWRAQTRARSR